MCLLLQCLGCFRDFGLPVSANYACGGGGGNGSPIKTRRTCSRSPSPVLPVANHDLVLPGAMSTRDNRLQPKNRPPGLRLVGVAAAGGAGMDEETFGAAFSNLRRLYTREHQRQCDSQIRAPFPVPAAEPAPPASVVVSGPVGRRTRIST